MDDLLATYPHKHPPFPQQAEALARSLTKRYFALFMEQGTGKTKVILDTACLHFLRGNISGLLVVAPNDVHEQWIIEQIPEHVPDIVKIRACVWRTSSERHVREAYTLVQKPLPNRLSVLAINHEALSIKKGRDIAKAFCRAYKTLLVIDESDLAIVTPRAERTKALVHQIGPLAAMRRIMTGTPAEDPFELYAPFNFLHPDIHGFSDYFEFKHHYADFETNHVRAKHGKLAGKLIKYETFKNHKNVDELHAKLAPYIYRVRKADCLNLPPKIYSTRIVSLTKAQRAIYDELKEQGIVLIKQANGRRESLDVQALEEVEEDDLIERLSSKSHRTTAALKLTLLLRLQQCVGGFLTDDEGTTRAIDSTPNPRQEALLQIVRNALAGDAKILIWACFRAEMQHLRTLLTQTFPDVLTEAVHGGTHSRTAKQDMIAAFKDPSHRLSILISHEKSLGVGMNFTSAQTVIFYTSGASGRSRVQAEDRCHRIGQRGAVNIYDFNAQAVPIDARLREFRQGKLDFNATVMGWTVDQLKELI
jgi:SNF2 family DNA or RNA helicase